MTANARFWIWENGAQVRITLRPGAEPLRWATEQATDEGWSAEGSTYYLVGETVIHEYWTDGVDCDGRLSSSGRLECHKSRLSVRRIEGETHRAPEWESVDSSRRDYNAEAAGY